MRKFTLIATCAGLAWSAQCGAQTVYESKDKSGATVFSDRPTPGAKPVELQSPNVIQTPPVPKRGPRPAAAPPPYTSVAITSLENEGTVHTNTGAFDIQVRSVPALRAAAGDRIRVKLDGRLLPPRYSTGAASIREEDWQAAAASDTQQHTLQVQIVDRAGTTLIESAPITFYAHRATARRKAR